VLAEARGTGPTRERAHREFRPIFGNQIRSALKVLAEGRERRRSR
jgi:hypothetical protein